MFRAALMRSLWTNILLSSLALAQEPPPLEPPVSEPPAPKASAAEPPRPAAPAVQSSPPTAAPAAAGPTLAIPGVTVPAARTRPESPTRGGRPSRPPAPPAEPSPAVASPVVEGPANAGSPFQLRDRAGGHDAPGADLLAPIPLTLEPLDDEPATERNRLDSAGSARCARRSSDSTSARESDDPIENPRPGPARMPGLLGRLLGQTPAALAPPQGTGF